ncbi:hypothetical protein Bhyg_08702, partial [Pseudolycoriella hygida]
MESYVNRMLLLAIKVQKVGFKIDDEILGSLLLCGLTSNYRPMIMGLENSEQHSESALIAKTKTRGNANKERKTVKCYHCEEIGHVSKQCPKRKAINDTDDAALLSSFSSAFLVSSQNNSDDWFFDSAATSNMTNDKSWLRNLNVSNKGGIITANNNVMKVDSAGDVTENILVNQQRKSVTIKNVQYVPDIVVNLLSVGQIVKNDNIMIFHKNGCEVYDSSRNVIATGSRINNMFKLDKVRLMPSSIENGFACIDNASSANFLNNAILLHRRLGHASFSNAIFLKKIGHK